LHFRKNLDGNHSEKILHFFPADAREKRCRGVFGGKMIRIEMRINGEHYKTVTLAQTAKISDIITRKEVCSRLILIFKIEHKYVNYDFELTENSKIDCVTFYSTEGYRIYQNTAIFILIKAFHKLFPDKSKIVIEHSIGDGVYAEKFNGSIFSLDDVKALKKEMKSIVRKKQPIRKQIFSSEKITQLFSKMNRKDILENPVFQNSEVYKSGNFYDYFVSQLADNTALISLFDIIYHSPGIILRFPEKKKFGIKKKFTFPQKLFRTHQEHDKWLKILRVHDVGALNRTVENNSIVDVIQVEEALHEKKIVFIAEQIWRRNEVRIVLIAGPSASGKTTFAKRLSVQLKVNGLSPRIISLDNYFLSRHLTPRKENGDYDFENIDALNLKLLNENLNDLLSGKEIEIPKYNFITGKSERSYNRISLKDKDILIIEGIHGLNEKLTISIPFNQKIKIYVSALNNLNIDIHNRIPTTDSRLMRRLVRDYNFRGYSAEQTLERWDSVREGEDKNIFPYQENADFMFNSALTYESGILKKHLIPILKKVGNFCPKYSEAERLQRILSHLEHIQDYYVPSNSILREFIGGSVFKY